MDLGKSFKTQLISNMKQFLAGFAMVLSAFGFASATEVKDSSIFGVGGLQCGEWLDVRKQSKDSAIRNVLEQWFFGYITAGQHVISVVRIGASEGAGNFRKVSEVTALSLMDKRCGENPIQSIELAARNVLLRDMLIARPATN